MLGCFTPNHPCIDNAIHCAAGPRLRAKCREIMAIQNSYEPTGKAKITPGYKLPCRYVFHTVGPIIKQSEPLKPDLLSSSYIECLNLAKENEVRSIAFCCISTGMFGYPNVPAANTALEAISEWLENEDNNKAIDYIIFNVFKDIDASVYNRCLTKYAQKEEQMRVEVTSMGQIIEGGGSVEEKKE